jgi:hypothetical protein
MWEYAADLPKSVYPGPCITDLRITSVSAPTARTIPAWAGGPENWNRKQRAESPTHKTRSLLFRPSLPYSPNLFFLRHT